MKLSANLPIFAILIFGALACLAGAAVGARFIENTSAEAVRQKLFLEGYDWADVEADGLQIVLTGTAPSEREQLAAQRMAGHIVDPARVMNVMNVVAKEAIPAPKFSIEILRNDNGISLIGLVPAEWDREDFIDRLKKAAGTGTVADFLEQADYPRPDAWDDATDFGVEAIERLQRSKISLSPNLIRVTALADSKEQKAFLETALKRETPDNIRVLMDIAAPRPVISPFTVRFVMDEDGASFDACAAETPAGQARILAAARAMGVKDPTCTLGLGAPTAQWARSVEEAMRAVAKLDSGSVTFSDADVTLIAGAGTSPAVFDKVVGELEASLTKTFTLHASLPEAENENSETEIAQFIVIRSPEGQVQLRGRLSDERSRSASDALARASFGANSVYSATRLDTDLPSGWSPRVLATIEALAKLTHGSATMTEDLVRITGSTGNQNAKAEIAGLLSGKLGDGQRFDIDVTYERKLDPVLNLPTPDECVKRANDVVSQSKIVFAPGSTDVDESSYDTLDSLAAALKDCEDVRMEIGGHTDSQGGEEMNQSLSQARANSVLDAMLARRIIGISFTAKGYGETAPIESNDTEEGREANRRIEFKLAGGADASDAPTDEAATEETTQTDAQESENAPAEEDAPDAGTETGTTE